MKLSFDLYAVPKSPSEAHEDMVEEAVELWEALVRLEPGWEEGTHDIPATREYYRGISTSELQVELKDLRARRKMFA